MTIRISVWCSNRGRHGRADIGAIEIADDGGVHAVRLRKAVPQWPPGAQILDEEGVAFELPPYQAVVADSIREDHEGNERWRFRCKRCRRDLPLSKELMRKLLDQILSNDGRGFDISLPPRL